MKPGWLPGFRGTVGSGDMVRLAEATLQVFTDLGVRPKGGSRLPNALRLLRALHERRLPLGPEDLDLQKRVADAHHTIWNFFVIAYAAERRWGRADSPFTPELLEEALGGADTVEGDQNPRARNTEFELYVAAYLCLGGAEILRGEPDWRLLYWEEHVGLAVKRMSSDSPNRLRDRMVGAADQLATWGGKGFLAINVDVLMRGLPVIGDMPVMWKAFNQRQAQVGRVIRRKFGKRRAVKGVLIFGFVAEWHFGEDGPRLPSAHPVTHVMIADEDEDQERSGLFFRGVQDRFHNALREVF